MRAAHIAGERRIVTTLFADVVGSTALAERMDAERWTAVMNHAFERLSPAIARYDGTLARVMGDALLAFFGAPVAHEDDPVRAVRAALDLVEAARAYALEVRRGEAIEFAIRVGISTGPAVLGDVGSELLHEYTAMGDAVNMAARLQAAAPPMGVLVGEATFHAISSTFDCADRGPMQMKGKSEPQRAYEVRGPRTLPERTRAALAGSRGLRSPMVGRDVELTALTTCIDRLMSGQGGVVGIIGEAGLGKSRLLAEVRHRVAERGVMWLEGHTLSFGQTISYWPFLEMLRHYVGIAEDDDAATSWSRLERSMAGLFPTDAAEVLPYLGTLLALEVPSALADRVRYLDGEAMRRQVFRTARLLLERLARQRPVVLVLEDLHWIDQSSAELLEHLLPLVTEVPLLVCGISRPEQYSPTLRLREVAGGQYADRYTEIVLSPLSAADSDTLVAHLLVIGDRFERVHELILQKAEGNPFFLEEVLRSLVEQRAVTWDEGAARWRPTAFLGEITIPDTVQGVIAARLDRLADEAKEALKLASVVGRSFLYRVLRAISDAADKLDRGLTELRTLELIHERAPAAELEYIFKHALIQETTYASILVARRKDLHERVGACIENLFPERLEEFYGLLAYHFARAENWEKAQEYLFRAGDQAGRLAADAEALAHYQQALAAYERAFGDRWDPLQRAIFERKMGEALFRHGDHDEARDYLLRALSRLGSPFPASRWAIRGTIARQLLVQLGHRLRPGRPVPRPASQPDPSSEERWRIYEELGWIDYQADRERLILDVLLGLNSAEQAGAPVTIAVASAGTGLACDLAHRGGLAEFYHRRALALAEATQHPMALGLAHHCSGFHDYFRNEWTAALAHFEQAASTYWAAGELRKWGASTAMATWVLRASGQLEGSMRRGRELIRIGRDGADHQVWGWGLALVGSQLRMAGSVEEATAHLEQAAELLEAVPDYLRLGFARAELGLCYLRDGKMRQAVALLEATNRQLAEHGVSGHFCSAARNGLAEAYLLSAEQALGSEKSALLKKARGACEVARGEAQRDREGLPGAYRAQGTYEWLTQQPKAAADWWRRSQESGDELGAHYELGLTHLEIGRRESDRDHLEQAEVIFNEMRRQLSNTMPEICP
jgi:class 3 adenylate cyclase/tetratricopeptide (TPR) repeat protein